MLNRVANVADKTVSPIVECIAESSAAGKKFDAERTRIKAEIIAGDRLCGSGIVETRHDCSAVGAASSRSANERIPRQDGDSCPAKGRRTSMSDLQVNARLVQ